MPSKRIKVCEQCDPGSYSPAKEIAMRDGTARMLCEMCLDDITCPECGAVEGTEEWGTVGDGFDGYCPSCADKREEAGVYD